MRYASEVDHHERAHSTSHIVCGLHQGRGRGRWLRIMAVSVSDLAASRNGIGVDSVQCPALKPRIDRFAAVFLADFIERLFAAFGLVLLRTIIPCDFFRREKQPRPF